MINDDNDIFALLSSTKYIKAEEQRRKGIIFSEVMENNYLNMKLKKISHLMLRNNLTR